MTRRQARARHRQIGEYFFGVWGLLVLLGPVLDDLGLQPSGWAWDVLIFSLSGVWVLLLGWWIWAFVRQLRTPRDPEGEFAAFLSAFEPWEGKLAQQGRLLHLAELHLGEHDEEPRLVAYVSQNGVPGERVVIRDMERDGRTRTGKKVSQELGLYLTELTSSQWDELEHSTRRAPGPVSEPA